MPPAESAVETSDRLGAGSRLFPRLRRFLEYCLPALNRVRLLRLVRQHGWNVGPTREGAASTASGRAQPTGQWRRHTKSCDVSTDSDCQTAMTRDVANASDCDDVTSSRPVRFSQRASRVR